jgi:hypothetical protein
MLCGATTLNAPNGDSTSKSFSRRRLRHPATALLAVWLSADLTRAQRWKLTQKMSIGFSAYENAFRYLLTGGRHSDGPRT